MIPTPKMKRNFTVKKIRRHEELYILIQYQIQVTSHYPSFDYEFIIPWNIQFSDGFEDADISPEPIRQSVRLSGASIVDHTGSDSRDTTRDRCDCCTRARDCTKHLDRRWCPGSFWDIREAREQAEQCWGRGEKGPKRKDDRRKYMFGSKRRCNQPWKNARATYAGNAAHSELILPQASFG